MQMEIWQLVFILKLIFFTWKIIPQTREIANFGKIWPMNKPDLHPSRT